MACVQAFLVHAFRMVRVEGLEPTRLAALDPKSSVSTNFTTPAQSERGAKVGIRIFGWNLRPMIFTLLSKTRIHWMLAATLCGSTAFGQGEESEPIRIQILQADEILRDRSQPDVQRLIGGVVLGMEESRLYCDSAWRYDDGTFRTMGNVQLRDDGQQIKATEMELNPETQWVRATAAPPLQVELQADAGRLVCPVIRYHMNRKHAVLPAGGRLTDTDRSVEFNRGRYHVEDALLMLGGNVSMDNADYVLDSDSLHWVETSERFAFHGPSHLRTTDQRFELRCSRGDFDVNTESGWFGGADRPGVDIRNDEVWLRADSIHLPEDTLRPSVAVGGVHVSDTIAQWTLSGAYAERLGRNSDVQAMWVAGGEGKRACWNDYSSDDSLRMVADTIDVAGEVTRVWPDVELQHGTSFAACDTLTWDSDHDEVHLEGEPKMWLEGWLLQSDSLDWELQNNRPERLLAKGHANLIAQVDSGLCYHQIAGRQMEGIFVEGTIAKLWVNGNAQSVYFNDEADVPCEEYNESLCSNMRIDFDAGEVKHIVLLDQPEGRWLSGAGEPPVLEGVQWASPPPVKR